MRIRTIKPEFWTDPLLARQEAHVRLLYIGLWNYVDDEGRGVLDAHLIRAALFPWEDVESVYEWLDVLEAIGRIHTYYAAGVPEQLFLIPKWSDHQRISKPKASRIPPAPFPDPSGTPPVSLPVGREGKGREQGREGNGLEAAAPPVDNNPNQPSDDQLYLAEKLDLSVPAIVKLNKRFGRTSVTEAMRHLHGFPPEDGVESVFAYLQTLCELQATA